MMANPSSVAYSIQKSLIGRSYGTELGVYYMRHVASASTSLANLTNQDILASLRLQWTHLSIR